MVSFHAPLPTIYAPATLIGASGLTVFRVSGARAKDSLKTLTKKENYPAIRQATVCSLYHPKTHQKIDQALVILFEGPHSFTGEDVVEYHLHGGRAIAHSMIDALKLMPEHKLAEPGEFTKRAFENGKIDLTQAEAVADLIHAETESQKTLALEQLDGSLRNLYEQWRETLTKALAYIEADIDFADEDLPDELSKTVRPLLYNILDEILYHLDDNNQGERLREGLKIAIIGAPNAGKSSLINALAKRDIAIVTDIAGTTRDIIEVHLNIGGYAVIVADTAGLRTTTNQIEQEGIRRAKQWAKEADLTIALFDSGAELDEETLAMITPQTVVASTKTDLAPAHKEIAGKKPLCLSSTQKKGLDPLLFHVKQWLDQALDKKSDGPLLTRTRHRVSLEHARDHLIRACAALQVDMMAEDTRLALRALGKITGHVDAEDLLDRIFNDFCIGK